MYEKIYQIWLYPPRDTHQATYNCRLRMRLLATSPLGNPPLPSPSQYHLVNRQLYPSTSTSPSPWPETIFAPPSPRYFFAPRLATSPGKKIEILGGDERHTSPVVTDGGRHLGRRNGSSEPAEIFREVHRHEGISRGR